MITKRIAQAISHAGVLTVALTVALLANFAYGQWANPTALPPNDNAEVPLNVSNAYQEKLGDLGALRMRSDQYCDADGNNCFTPTGSTTIEAAGPGSGDIIEIGGVCFTPVPVVECYWNWSGTGNETKTLINETSCGANHDKVRSSVMLDAVPCQIVSCEVEIVSRARSDYDTRIVTMNSSTIYGTAAVALWQHPDDNAPFNFTTQTAADSWGSSWNDNSERIRVGFLSDARNNGQTGPAVRELEARSDNYTEIDQFPLVAGETASVVGKSVSGISAGLARVSATVLSCVNI